MAGKNILVTGGAGFIGSHLTDALIEKGHQVTILDNFCEQVHQGKRPDYLNQNASVIEGNVADYDTFKSAVIDSGAEIVFHKAAAVGIGQSNYEIRRFVESNVLGTANLLHILANEKHSVKKFVIPGSNTSYGEGLYGCKKCGSFHPKVRSEADVKNGFELRCPKCNSVAKPLPTPETTELYCNSIYSMTKRDQEDMALFVGRAYNIPCVVLRYFNVFGPRQSLSNPYTGVTAIFTSRIKNNNPPKIFEDGQQTRDFVSVHDVVAANLLAMESKKANNEIFNIATGKATTITELANTLIKLLGSKVKPEISKEFRKGDIRHCIADNSKAKRLLGWQPKVSLEAGLKELIGWSVGEKAVDGFEKAQRELKEKGLV
jgi:dTDP-L-rhamnose 4-epimerase